MDGWIEKEREREKCKKVFVCFWFCKLSYSTCFLAYLFFVGLEIILCKEQIKSRLTKMPACVVVLSQHYLRDNLAMMFCAENKHSCCPPCMLLQDLFLSIFTSALCCCRRGFEPSTQKALGAPRLWGKHVENCQMDLCPSQLGLALGPWQQIRTESYYKGATDTVETELD